MKSVSETDVDTEDGTHRGQAVFAIGYSVSVVLVSLAARDQAHPFRKPSKRSASSRSVTYVTVGTRSASKVEWEKGSRCSKGSFLSGFLGFRAGPPPPFAG